MLIYASCAARERIGVLLTGPAGSGKSDLLLRLIDRGYELVADDQVDIADGRASPPPSLAGLIEVRGLGILRMNYVADVALALSVQIGPTDRLPSPARDPHGLPLIAIDPALHTAAQRIDLGLDCALGQRSLLAGALASC